MFLYCVGFCIELFVFLHIFPTLSTSTPKPGLGLTTTQPATTGLTLGSLVASSSGSGFTFGGGLSTQAAAAPAAASTSQPSAGGFSLAQPSGGFSFGVTKVQVTTASSTAAAGAGFSFGVGTSAPTTQPTFSLGGPTPGERSLHISIRMCAHIPIISNEFNPPVNE